MIVNEYGRTAFSFRPDTLVEGMPCEGLEVIARPYPNPKRREIWTLTVGGTAADGDYSATFTGDDGTAFTVKFTRAAGEANGAIATAYAAALLADPARKGVILSATVDSLVVSVRFKHPGRGYTVTSSAPAGATFVAAESLSHEGQILKVGRFVVPATLEGLASMGPPGNSATAADMLGVILRPHTGITRPTPALATDEPSIVAGNMVAPALQVIVALRNMGAAAVDGGVVHVVINTAGGQERGQVRGDADGGNTVALALTQARWLAATPTGALGPVMVTL